MVRVGAGLPIGEGAVPNWPEDRWLRTILLSFRHAGPDKFLTGRGTLAAGCDLFVKDDEAGAFMRSIFLGVGVVLAFATSALAQSPNSAQPSSPSSVPTPSQATGSISSQGQNSSTQIRDKVQQNLSKAGFTDIKVMPESFLVRAKDPSGNLVMMVINPDSVTAVTYGANQSANPGNSNPTSQGNGNSAKGGNLSGK